MLKRYFPVVAILLAALFVTLMYGLPALLGAVWTIDVVEVWTGTHTWKNTNDSADYKIAFQGLGGILGILGLWVSGLFYIRLSTTFSAFNIVVIIFLICGIVGAIVTSFDLLFPRLESEIDLTTFFYIEGPLLLVCFLSCYLVYRFMMPNKSHQPTAYGGG